MAKKSNLAKEVLPKIKFHAAGSYGTYGHYGKVGLKLIAAHRYSADRKNITPCEFKSRKACENSRAYKDAIKEAEMLKKAGKLSTLPPKFYEVGIYKLGKAWVTGIFMEHINGRKALRHPDCYKIVSVVKTALEEVGIEYLDGNENNYIFDRVRKCWRIIDFSPGWIRFYRK